MTSLPAASTSAGRTVYAVGELNEILRALIEDSLPSLWVQGEISNFSKPASGHWYFTLKDAQAQIRCAMFRGSNFYIRPLPGNGDAVLVRAKAGVYPARGELQLIVEHLEPAGSGALLRAFEKLKQKLAAEGLFDAGLKRPLPPLPRRIGLVTSDSGAALHDVLTALARRWPLAEVIFHPSPVQGAGAPAALVAALGALTRRAEVDVVLLVRGGGSIEDLWAFNSEALARAIRACPVPVVTGVGHEVDITIADFAADLRAATPTAAAELATPDIAEREQRLRADFEALCACIARRLEINREQLAARGARLHALHPGRRLNQRAQRLDELSERLMRGASRQLATCGERFWNLAQRFGRVTPTTTIAARRTQLQSLAVRLDAAMLARLATRSARLDASAALLAGISPQAVLARGYAVVRDVKGRVVRDAADMEIGDALNIDLARGSVRAAVKRIKPG